MRVASPLQASREVQVTTVPPPETVDGVQIDWHVHGRVLTSVSFVIPNAPMHHNPVTGPVLTRYPALESHAFTAASCVANRVLVQTGIDAFRPYGVVGHSADISPETAEE